MHSVHIYVQCTYIRIFQNFTALISRIEKNKLMVKKNFKKYSIQFSLWFSYTTYNKDICARNLKMCLYIQKLAP
jgi:hypothetical protein